MPCYAMLRYQPLFASAMLADTYAPAAIFRFRCHAMPLILRCLTYVYAFAYYADAICHATYYAA